MLWSCFFIHLLLVHDLFCKVDVDSHTWVETGWRAAPLRLHETVFFFNNFYFF